ncbi:TPA: hypothetical protein RG917_001294 [Pseudomonas aeruginosa]|uniref:ATP-binding protein n=1 Tax=Stutzerimonas stutzeri TaxID=316 RepID=A0ABD4XWK7_STUST|nr:MULTISPECIES: hypothetical protein [Pseudomonadaceae]MDH0687243.1 ATP-binding protein [Stutzerimonas stutzeri]MDH2200746.1 ATP-binding protein [Pseudomonas oleovorans]UWU63984.1 ATP-binding protein [Pseudomonas aeruginosa]HCE5838036.1 hypothetical protein [Pseudomonas aeruginosa]HCE9265610.1 hypothetical protein [Pseudomonas aeruginosa]
MHSAADLFEELSSVDEPTGIESNRASELGKSLMQTVVAFSNEPELDGGYLLLGANGFVNDRGYTVLPVLSAIAPFTLADRVSNYRVAWANFESAVA